MPDKLESTSKSSRAEAKPRKKEQGQSAAEREAALVLAATQFKALGDPTRLRIINFLSSVELLSQPATDAAAAEDTDSGRTVGDVSTGVFGKSKVSSTLSHHLKELRNAGLITMKRRGKNLICRIQPETIEALRCYLPDPVLISVTTKAQNAAPLTDIEPLSTETEAPTTVDVNAEVPMPERTRVRKSAVRKKKSTEGASHIEPSITTDDATTA